MLSLLMLQFTKELKKQNYFFNKTEDAVTVSDISFSFREDGILYFEDLVTREYDILFLESTTVTVLMDTLKNLLCKRDTKITSELKETEAYVKEDLLKYGIDCSDCDFSDNLELLKELANITNYMKEY